MKSSRMSLVLWSTIGSIVIALAMITATPISHAAPSNTYTVTNTNDSDAGSLRQAILDANANPGLDTITFNIPGAGVKSIAPLSPLPIITSPVMIDGYGQPGASLNSLAVGNNAVLLIELNGTSAGAGAHGLTIGAGGEGSEIYGLVINRFSGNGIYITSNSNVIAGNFIGTDVTGTEAAANGNNGILISNSVFNRVGGLIAGYRNLISGNAWDGIYINGSGSTENIVRNNYLGTHRNGTLAIPNAKHGVEIANAAYNVIGGNNAGAGNLISGNTLQGVFVTGSTATENIVQGNLIGVNVAGNGALPNTSEGVSIDASANHNHIGSAAGYANGGNLISGNTGFGVAFGVNTHDNFAQGNYIGLDATGTITIPNNLDGVVIVNSQSNQIGGLTVTERNIISGNGGYGVKIAGTLSMSNTVQGNHIGTDVTGNSARGNAGGVLIDNSRNNLVFNTLISGNATNGLVISNNATGNSVGGNVIGTNFDGTLAVPNNTGGIVVTNASANTIGNKNWIASNGGIGIKIVNGTGNRMYGNGIISNTGLGIDLVGTGNHQQTFPILTSVTMQGSTAINVRGTITSSPNTTYTLEFFASPVCDPSGYGEGQYPLGTTTVTTNASGNATFVIDLTGTVTPGNAITATATDPNNNTSKFSACKTAKAQLFLPLILR